MITNIKIILLMIECEKSKLRKSYQATDDIYKNNIKICSSFIDFRFIPDIRYIKYFKI